MKNKKLIGLASLMLVLGAIGCKKDPETPQECEKHTWGETEVVTAATCTEKGVGKRKCEVCGKEEDNVAIPALKHDYKDEATGGKEPTCTEDGYKMQKCSRCGDEKQVKLSALDHDYKDDTEGYVAPTCTEKGKKNQTCSRCGDKKTDVEIPALNHDYGDWETVTEPDCVTKGKKKQVCKVCGFENFDDIDPLGHDLKVIGDDEAEEGKALVRVYECNRCHDTYLGFKANEPSVDSKNHLVIGDDGGARFWGRPIGNSLALTEDGSSVAGQDGEVVYCKDETGDFFEYVFDLDPEQAAKLSSCRLYCDATPANYLSGDFWACSASAQEYTPGYYIDGADDHVEWEDDAENPGQQKKVMVNNHARVARGTTEAGAQLDEMVPMGKRIRDYRYILYVDGNPVEFDKKTEVKVDGSGTNMVRKEYELPYTFNLHTGENRISLRMAGGYRSVFYNFTFRPYTPPVDITVAASTLEVREGKTAKIENISETGVTFKSDKESVATVDENGVVTGVKPGTAKITISKEGNYRAAEVEVTVLEKEGVITLNLLDATISENGISRYDSSSSGTWYRNPKKDGTMTYTFQSTAAGKYDIVLGLRNNANDAIDLATNMGIKVNDVDVAVTGSVKTQYDPVDFVVGEADLTAGDNTMVITFLADSALYIKTLKFSPADEEVVPPQPVHEHAWTAAEDPAEGATDAVVKKYTCECGKVKYEIAASTGNFQLDGSSKWKDDASDPTKGEYFKLKTNGHSFHFTFALPKAFSGQMYQRGYMDSYGSNKVNKLYYQTNSEPNIAVTVNNAENPIAMTGAYPAVEGKTYEDVTFGDVFGDETNGTNSTVKDVLIGNIELGTTNTITYKRVQTVNLTVSHLVFIGTEVNA